jgi:tetratricopeptide (TPR) repeat protein
MTFTPIDPNKIKEAKTIAQHNKLTKKGEYYTSIHQYGEALKYYTKAWIYPDFHPNLYINVARCLFFTGHRGKALATLEMAMAKSDNNPEVSYQSAIFALEIKEFAIAVEFSSIYFALKPDDTKGIELHCDCLRENGQMDEAIDLLQSFLPIYPTNGRIWNVLAMSVFFRDGPEAAMVFAEEAYRLEPKIMGPVQTLSLIHTDLDDLIKARFYVERLLEINSESHYIYRNYSNICLALGDMKAGMDALEWNNHPSDPNAVHMPYNFPRWTGQDLTEKTIFVAAEQGVGDQMIFVAALPQLAQKAKKIILGCDNRLITLYQNSFSDRYDNIEIIGFKPFISTEGQKITLYDGIESIDIDYMCLYTDVMRRLWDKVENVPDLSDGYFHPAQKDVEYWADKLKTLPKKINVGFSWRSGIRTASRDKSFSGLEDWLVLLKNKDVNYINLQYGECSEELEYLKEAGITVHNFDELNLKDDFNGTGALMKCLDVVLGPGTATTHEAAAVGTETYWFLNQRTEWFFGQDGLPLFKSNKFFVKPYNQSWADHYAMIYKDRLLPWIKQKKKILSN